jgi:hypothetical protein
MTTWNESDVRVLGDGPEVTATLRFAAGDVCRVEVLRREAVIAIGEAGDLFEALVGARRALERTRLLLGCNGSRRDVYPSPMLRQAAHGRRAYVLVVPRTADRPATVDIFEAAPDLATVVTVDEQRASFDRWCPPPSFGRTGSA